MEKVPPSPSYFNLIVFLSLKRREREGGGEIDRITFLTGRAKGNNRREMNKGEGKTKQGTEKMELIDPLSLISPFPFSF